VNNRVKELIKFTFTGGICFLIEYAALVILKEWLHLPVVTATPIAFLISVAFNYLLCVKWVFSGAKEGSRKAQIGFAVTSVMGLFLNWILMWALTSLLGEDSVLLTFLGLELKIYMLHKAVATLLVMVWNYFTKRWLLKGNKL